ncbi:cupin domain-containing protein [Vandammella animalimorsus]|uniref:cupin domain-containing protein n=1 Tax=Vandammella animalimorsus TaxID=2029117 RepID=UPI00325AEC3D
MDQPIPALPPVLDVAAHLQAQPQQAVRTLLHTIDGTNLVLWQIPPGASLPPHRHPHGTDIWFVLQGSAELLDDAQSRRSVHAGHIVPIERGQRHGVRNTARRDCVLVSVVPADAGFEPLS